MGVPVPCTAGKWQRCGLLLQAWRPEHRAVKPDVGTPGRGAQWDRLASAALIHTKSMSAQMPTVVQRVFSVLPRHVGRMMMAVGDTGPLGPTPLSDCDGRSLVSEQMGPGELNAPATPFAPAPNPHLPLHFNRITLISHSSRCPEVTQCLRVTLQVGKPDDDLTLRAW